MEACYRQIRNWCKARVRFRFGQHLRKLVCDRPVPVVTADLRSATAVRSTRISLLRRGFHPFHEAGRRFVLSRSKIWQAIGIVLEHRLQTAPTINGRIDDTGVSKASSRAGTNDLGLVLRSGRFRPPSSISKNERSVPRWARTRSVTECRPRSSACWW